MAPSSQSLEPPQKPGRFTSSGHLATKDQGGKGLAFEFVSSDSNTTGGQAKIEFAMK